MLNKENIIELIRQGEGYYLEFKESLNKDIPKEICAFANSAGGTLLIGVDDHNRVVGTRYDNKIASQLQNQLDTIDPHLDVTIGSIDIDGVTVIAITCKTGPQKPHTYGGSIYIRQGPNTQKITSQLEMVDLFQKADRVFFDETSCSRFSFTVDFDEPQFREFQKAAGISNILDMDVILDNLQLVTENGHFKNASVLFFSQEPQLKI